MSSQLNTVRLLRRLIWRYKLTIKIFDFKKDLQLLILFFLHGGVNLFSKRTDVKKIF